MLPFELRKEKEALLEERARLTLRKNAVQQEISELGISKNAVWKRNAGKMQPSSEKRFDTEGLRLRDQLAKEARRIDARCTEIKIRIDAVNNILSDDKSKFSLLNQILKEGLPPDIYDNVMKELDNRQIGITNMVQIVSTDDNKAISSKYKAVAKDALDRLIQARKNLNGVVDDGCNRFDKGFFLQCLSPLNRLLPRIEDIEKLKVKNNIN